MSKTYIKRGFTDRFKDSNRKPGLDTLKQKVRVTKSLKTRDKKRKLIAEIKIFAKGLKVDLEPPSPQSCLVRSVSPSYAQSYAVCSVLAPSHNSCAAS